jgi:GTP-dependent phosphoenolpyruvate carboxykinase
MSTSVDAWVEHVAGYTKPARVRWCTGEPAELEQIGREAGADPDGADKPELSMSARRREDIGDTSTFLTRAQATQRYWEPFWGSMHGRVMYVVPYELATGTPLAEAGVQLTDDPRLVVDLARTMHVDPSVRRAPRYVRALHARHAKCAPAICCFVEGRTIWAPAVASQDFLDARVHALRLASTEVEATGRLPTRMAVVEIESEGRTHHVGVIAPNRFGRSQASMLGTSRSGTGYRTLASKAAWLAVDGEGLLTATLCERSDAVDDGTIAPPQSVVLSAIVLCTRRSSLVPLVLELPGWDNACYSGALLQAGVDGDAGSLVDPMGMRDFCGSNLNDYLAQWLALGPRLRKSPKIFQLNWFLRDADDHLAWPGAPHAWRLVDWMVARIESRAPARATVAGFAPKPDALDRSGLEIDEQRWRAMFDVDPAAWRAEVDAHEQGLAQLGRGVPLELRRAHSLFAGRVDEIAGRQARSEEACRT